MPEKFDNAELLALVEGELDPKQAAGLRRRLAGDPKLLTLVERLQEDRRMLRAMEDPPVPAGLLAELEPMMARPMLMPDSGDWRRRYRKRRPWRRYAAVAALVCLAALAGVWAVTSGVFERRPDAPRELAYTDEPVPAPAAGDASPPAVWPPAGSTIHHRGPVGAMPDMVAAREPDGSSRPRRDRGAPPPLTTADFVLVVRADAGDEQAVQDALQRAVQRLDGGAALVRNFSFQEAEQLARRLEARNDRRLDGALARARDDFAGLSAGDHVAAGADRVVAAGRLARTLEQSADTLAVGGRLVGPKTLAPTYEQQLEYAEGGATWTITVPADRLNDVLADLQVTEGRRTVLQLRAGGAPVTGAERWLADYPAILREAARLDGTVMVPVVLGDQ